MLNKRIDWIDTASGINIFLVVLGHTILPQHWINYIFSLHIPLFFLISGYLFNPQKYPNLLSFFKRRAVTLLLPYLLFSLVGYIYWFIYFGSKYYLDPFWQMLQSGDKLYPPVVPLWFLTCLFVVEIYFYILSKKLRSWPLVFAVLVSTIFGFYLSRHKLYLVWGIDIALVAVIFYFLGFELRYNKYISKILNMKWLGLGAIFFIVLNIILVRFHDYPTSMIYHAYGIEWVFVSAAVTGSLGYLMLAKFLKQTILKKIALWEFIGQNSLLIFGLHTITYYYVSDLFKDYFHIHPQASVLYAFIYTIITILILVPIIYLINRGNKKLRFGRAKSEESMMPITWIYFSFGFLF